MRLEDIGFYTLEDHRAENLAYISPLWRCELLLTGRCNFACPYCRKRDEKDLSFEEAKYTVKLWADQGLKNIRFSGGEPCLWKGLSDLVEYAASRNINRIAISTNGSMPTQYYKHLIDCGVNDFSISLDACCASVGEKMCGGIPGMWEKVINNIRELSKLTYTTVGVVFTEDTAHTAKEVIEFADSLGVSDIRIIPSAQYNKHLVDLNVSENILNKHPILKYRINNAKNNRSVRGIGSGDCEKCYLVLDDMAVLDGKHYPCIIALREGCEPIGTVGPNMRQERIEWFKKHNSKLNPICSGQCLEVCVAYNNKAKEMNKKCL